MNKDFVDYQIAYDMKSLGFDEPCLRVGNTNGHTMWKWIEVDKDNETISVNDILNVEYMEGYIQIPTFSQCFGFFREEFGYYSDLFVDDDKTFGFMISSFTEEGILEKPIQRNYNSYEEAELAAIVKLIEIVKE
jgi:hypothetical protein